MNPSQRRCVINIIHACILLITFRNMTGCTDEHKFICMNKSCALVLFDSVPISYIIIILCVCVFN